MKINQAYMAILILTLLASAFFVSIANSQEQTTTPEDIYVILEKPDNNTAKTDNFNVTFTFTPVIEGADKFYSASLLLNGTIAAMGH